MSHSVRSFLANVVLVAAWSSAAAACGGSTTAETPRADGGAGPHKDATDDVVMRHGDAGSDAPRSPPDGSTTCGLLQILQPILTVKDAKTGALICDAAASGGGATLYSCGTGMGMVEGCTSKCQYSVGGLESSSPVTITVTAPGYASATVSVTVEYCGCNGDCGGPQQATVSLNPGDQTDAAPPPPDASPAPACPPSEPTKGGACTLEGLYCQYGTNPNPSCDDVWQCESSAWQIVTKSGVCAAPTDACPASYATASANLKCAMADEQQICEYPQGTCICTSDPGGLPLEGPPQWSCSPVTAGCPAAPPTLGSECPKDTPSDCDYGQCSGGVGMTCVGGYWALALVACAA